MKKIILIFLFIAISNIAFGEMAPLAPPIDPLSHDQVDILFKKIERNEKIGVNLLHQALQGPQTTLRAYTARVLGEQGDETSIPYLIDALSDESMHEGANYPEAGMATTRYWVNESLKKLTGEDFGFIWNDPKDKRVEAIRRWRDWYLKKYLNEPC